VDLVPGAQAPLARERRSQPRADRRQSGDVSLRVVDASVLALVERLAEPKVATLDQRHFRAVRPAHIEALELLP